jgi:hypothetical protein
LEVDQRWRLQAAAGPDAHESRRNSHMGNSPTEDPLSCDQTPEDDCNRPAWRIDGEAEADDTENYSSNRQVGGLLYVRGNSVVLAHPEGAAGRPLATISRRLVDCSYHIVHDYSWP